MLSDHRGCYFLIHLSDSLHCLTISRMVIPPASHQAIWSRSSAVILWCFFIPIVYWVSPYCSDPKLNLGICVKEICRGRGDAGLAPAPQYLSSPG
jgi:hypothetical protein